jgi:hypothetical protein
LRKIKVKKLPENYEGPEPPSGVTWCPDRGKWLVRVRDGVLKNIGYFSSLGDAIELNSQARSMIKIRKDIARKERIKNKLKGQ